MVLMWIAAFVVVLLVFASIRIVNQWEKGVVLTLGKYTKTVEPGVNLIAPFIQTMSRVDMRLQTIDIPWQQVITKDNVPVKINGVIYFRVNNPEVALLKIQDFTYAISQYAQTALKDVVGGMSLDQLLAEREEIGKQIETVVDKETSEWGLDVASIKMQDVDMPEDLKRIMSRQASAEREKRANITKSEGDKLAAVNLAAAAKIMDAMPGAMQLRTLQTIDGLGPTPSNTVVLLPVEVLDAFKEVFSKKKQ